LIDFHTHSLFSDGVLVPAELVQRAQVKGYSVIAITDHADHSNLDLIVPRMVSFCQEIKDKVNITVIPGVELTHLPPVMIPDMAQKARSWGAKIIIVHGETMVEPVPPGTNAAALEADIDILAHPGLIEPALVEKAKKRKILLEITTRQGHSLSNGHVASWARHYNAPLILNTDAHAPGDLVEDSFALRVALGAGLSREEYQKINKNALDLLKKIQK
jgi:histidinol phosphatase-like PHP family hydrolase